MRHNVFRQQLTTPHREHHRQRFIQDNTRQNRLSLRRDSLFDLVDVNSQHFTRSFYLDKEFRRTQKAEGKKQFYYLTTKNTPTQAQLQEQSRLLASSDVAIEHLFDRQLQFVDDKHFTQALHRHALRRTLSPRKATHLSFEQQQHIGQEHLRRQIQALGRDKNREKRSPQGMSEQKADSVNYNFRLMTNHGTRGMKQHTEQLMRRLRKKKEVDYKAETLRYIDQHMSVQYTQKPPQGPALLQQSCYSSFVKFIDKRYAKTRSLPKDKRAVPPQPASRHDQLRRRIFGKAPPAVKEEAKEQQREFVNKMAVLLKEQRGGGGEGTKLLTQVEAE